MYCARRWSFGVLWMGVSALGCSSDPGAAAPQSPPVAGRSEAAGSVEGPPAEGAPAGGASSAPVASGTDGITPVDVALEPEAAPAGGSSEANASDAPSPAAEGSEPGAAEEAPVEGAPAPVAIDPAALPEITLHLAGDSTVMTYEPSSAQEGWGQELGQFFNDRLDIDNQAIGGASVQSFHESSRWRNITSSIEPGDFVMAAFGANDSGTVAGRHVEPAAYRDLFRQMSVEVEAEGATFIVVTPSAMQEWRAGEPGNLRLGPYVAVLNTLAPLEGLLLDDLNARSLEFLGAIGQTAAEQIYINGDKAHFTKAGATQMASIVAEELARIGSPLAAYLK